MLKIILLLYFYFYLNILYFNFIFIFYIALKLSILSLNFFNIIKFRYSITNFTYLRHRIYIFF